METTATSTTHRKARSTALRARRARKRRAFAALSLLWATEVLAAAAIGAVVASIIVPFANAERGYVAFGGEWAFVLITALLAYHIIHGAVFKRLEK